MDNGTGWRHPVLFDCLEIPFLSFDKVGDQIAGLQVTGLYSGAGDQIVGGDIGTLRIVDQHAGAVEAVKVGVQQDQRISESEKLPAYILPDLRADQNNPFTVGETKIGETVFQHINFLVELHHLYCKVFFLAFAFDPVIEFVENRRVGEDRVMGPVKNDIDGAAMAGIVFNFSKVVSVFFGGFDDPGAGLGADACFIIKRHGNSSGG